jgi:endonuclease/exonuclease/phosphatase (EEP) superfamily protein YafD
VATVPVALWAAIRVLGLEGGSALTTAMFFTPYAAVGALLVTGIATALRNWASALIAAVATACLVAAVLPRAIGDDTVSPAGQRTLTVLSTNVYLGDADPAAVLALVDRYDADVLSVQELTPSFAAKLRGEGIATRLPHSVLMASARGSGGGLYARFPLTALPRQTHFRFRMPRAAMAMPGGQRMRLVAVHPTPPNLDFDQWHGALRSLPWPGAGSPWLLIGDFNATFDQAEFRNLVDSGYRDAGDATGKGLEPTWTGDEGAPWGFITIDHVLADRRLGIADYGVDDLAGSDHRAVHAQLVLP